MPNHVGQRIASLRELVRQGLHEENLDRMVQECSALAQDSPHVLVFFTLKNIFREMAEALDSGAVELARFEELTVGVAQKADSLLQKLVAETPIEHASVEDLVRTHIVNLNLFRS